VPVLPTIKFFTKILIGKTGLIEKVFDSVVSPLGQRVKDAVEQ